MSRFWLWTRALRCNVLLFILGIDQKKIPSGAKVTIPRENFSSNIWFDFFLPSISFVVFLISVEKFSYGTETFAAPCFYLNCLKSNFFFRTKWAKLFYADEVYQNINCLAEFDSGNYFLKEDIWNITKNNFKIFV